jgi:hypothetical protein
MGTSERNRHKKKTAAFREMTAAHVREMPGAEFAEVMFLESARIYRLSKNNPKYQETLKYLREAIAKEGVVRVLLDQPHGSIIQALEADV